LSFLSLCFDACQERAAIEAQIINFGQTPVWGLHAVNLSQYHVFLPV
jgi:hypothetical protein